MGAAFLAFLPWAGGTGYTTPLLALVGLSLSTKVAPERFRTQMVALNFLSVALGTATAGSLAKYYDVDREDAYFATVGGAAVLFGVLIFLGTPSIRRLMSGVH